MDNMGSKSQRKGANGERELAAILKEYGYDCTRGGSLSFGEIPDIVGLPGVHIEVKRVEKLKLARPWSNPSGTVSGCRTVFPLCSTGETGNRGL